MHSTRHYCSVYSILKPTMAVLLLLATGLSYGLGRTIAYDELAQQFFANIQSVSGCGNSFDNEMSEYRLIHGAIYGGDMLFIDKITFKEDRPQVAKGYSFQEINNDHLELMIENVSCELDTAGQLTLSGSINGSGHSDTLQYDFIIHLNTRDGRYQYTRIDAKQ